ncbi:hypothetical protein FGB62_60g12 [Gracilaria domingensis]|nr:hypothetical protein FGB62_60g12 [Gracilaria domingensis]
MASTTRPHSENDGGGGARSGGGCGLHARLRPGAVDTDRFTHIRVGVDALLNPSQSGALLPIIIFKTILTDVSSRQRTRAVAHRGRSQTGRRAHYHLPTDAPTFCAWACATSTSCPSRAPAVVHAAFRGRRQVEAGAIICPPVALPARERRRRRIHAPAQRAAIDGLEERRGVARTSRRRHANRPAAARPGWRMASMRVNVQNMYVYTH